MTQIDYKKNYKALLLSIDTTAQQIDSLLKDIPKRSFVIYHPALSYFAKEWNMKEIAIENNGKSPSAKQLQVLVNRAKEEGVKVVFIQLEFDPQTTETIARELNAKAVVINPLAADWHKSMLNIAEVLAKASKVN